MHADLEVIRVGILTPIYVSMKFNILLAQAAGGLGQFRPKRVAETASLHDHVKIIIMSCIQILAMVTYEQMRQSTENPEVVNSRLEYAMNFLYKIQFKLIQLNL